MPSNLACGPNIRRTSPTSIASYGILNYGRYRGENRSETGALDDLFNMILRPASTTVPTLWKVGLSLIGLFNIDLSLGFRKYIAASLRCKLDYTNTTRIRFEVLESRDSREYHMFKGFYRWFKVCASALSGNRA